MARDSRAARSVLGLTLAVAALVWAPAAAAHEVPALELLTQLETALNRGDVAAAAGLFADEAVLREDTHPAIRSHSQIRDWLRSRASERPTIDLGDVGLLHGSGESLEWTAEINEPGGTSRRVSGRATAQRGRITTLTLDSDPDRAALATDESPSTTVPVAPFALGVVASAVTVAAAYRLRTTRSAPVPSSGTALSGHLVLGLRRWGVETGRIRGMERRGC